MAITTNATILIRRGLEEDFDASKMKQGEWALSTDTKFIRMCVAPGICLRIATYEAFEADMQRIENLVEECSDTYLRVKQAQHIIEQKADRVEVLVEDAEIYANLAKKYAEEAKHFTPEGYEELVEEVSSQKESFIQYEQSGFLSNNILNIHDKSTQIVNGITYTPHYENGVLQYIDVDGTATSQANYTLISSLTLKSGQYFIGGSTQNVNVWYFGVGNGAKTLANDVTNGFILFVNANTTVNHEKIYPYINKGLVDKGFTPYAKPNTELTQSFQENKDTGYLRSDNLLNYIGYGTINTDDGKTIVANSNVIYTDYMRVDGKQVVFAINGDTSVAWRCFEYDENKNYISGSASTGRTGAYTPHANCVYIRTQTGANTNEKRTLNFGSTPIQYTDYVPSNIELNKSFQQYTTPIYIPHTQIGNYIGVVDSSKVELQTDTPDNNITICGKVVTLTLRIHIKQALSGSTKILTIADAIKPFGWSQNSNGIVFNMIKTWDRSNVTFAEIGSYFDGIALLGEQETGIYIGTVTYIRK